jgi:hypothetical protein
VWEFRTITTSVQTSKRLRNIANALFENGNYTDAHVKYVDAAKVIVSTEVPLPTKGGMRDDTYMNFDWWGRIELMACCNGVAKCTSKMGDLNKVFCLP